MGGAFKPCVVSYVGTSGKTYTVAYNVTFNPASAAPTAAQNAKITVTVSWTDVSSATAHVTLVWPRCFGRATCRQEKR